MAHQFRPRWPGLPLRRGTAHRDWDMPEDPAARVVLPDPPCLAEPLRRLDLHAAGIGAVVWATGYGFDLGWIEVPVLDARGAPVHRGGICLALAARTANFSVLGHMSQDTS